MQWTDYQISKSFCKNKHLGQKFSALFSANFSSLSYAQANGNKIRQKRKVKSGDCRPTKNIYSVHQAVHALGEVLLSVKVTNFHVCLQNHKKFPQKKINGQSWGNKKIPLNEKVNGLVNSIVGRLPIYDGR